MKENDTDQLRATRRLLHEISQLCEHASLTGSLSGGAQRTVLRYNAILTQLLSTGAVPEGLFAPLDSSAEYGEVGVEARMLASYIREGEKQRSRHDVHDPGILVRLAPFVESRDLSALIREQMQQGIHLDMNILTSIAPFLGKEELGMLLREHIDPSSPRSGQEEREERRDRSERRGGPERPPRPDRPERPARESTPFPPGMGWPFTKEAEEPESPTAALTLDEALDRLRRPDLTDEERDQLVRQVRELATE